MHVYTLRERADHIVWQWNPIFLHMSVASGMDCYASIMCQNWGVCFFCNRAVGQV